MVILSDKSHSKFLNFLRGTIGPYGAYKIIIGDFYEKYGSVAEIFKCAKLKD